MSGKTSNCASCGTPLEPRTGPGRRAAYCGETCRRMAEFAVRSLVKRIDVAEIELRELRSGSDRYSYFDPDERRRRVRFLRRWIVEDKARLHALLGGNNDQNRKET